MQSQDKVIFRKFKEGDIIALFPEYPGTNTSDCMSYMHLGQHSAAEPMHIIDNTSLAIESEYKPLLQELISIGYNPKVYKKYTYGMYKARCANYNQV